MEKKLETKLNKLVSNLKDNKISFDDIERTFPNISDDCEILEDVLVYLENLGIEVVESEAKTENSRELSLVIDEYCKYMAKYPLLSKEEEVYYGTLKNNGNKEACEALFNGNWRLVLSLIAGKKRYQMSYEDLLQEGNIGLMTAIEKFDPDKGYKFSTYATWWIRQAITRSIQNKELAIRLPVHLNEKLYKIKQTYLSLADKLYREPTYQEIADELNLPLERLLKLLSYSSDISSLDQKVKPDEYNDVTTISSFVPDPYNNVELEIEEEEKIKVVNELLFEIFTRDLDLSLTEEELFYCFELYRKFDVERRKLLEESCDLKIALVEKDLLYYSVKEELSKRINNSEVSSSQKEKYIKLLNNLSKIFTNKYISEDLKEIIDYCIDKNKEETTLFKDLEKIDDYYDDKIKNIVFDNDEINEMYNCVPIYFPDFYLELDTYKKIYDRLKYVDVLKRRNGFVDEYIFSHADIALMYSLSRERIRQIEEKGLTIARKALTTPYYQNKYRGYIPPVNKILSKKNK